MIPEAVLFGALCTTPFLGIASYVILGILNERYLCHRKEFLCILKTLEKESDKEFFTLVMRDNCTNIVKTHGIINASSSEDKYTKVYDRFSYYVVKSRLLLPLKVCFAYEDKYGRKSEILHKTVNNLLIPLLKLYSFVFNYNFSGSSNEETNINISEMLDLIIELPQKVRDEVSDRKKYVSRFNQDRSILLEESKEAIKDLKLACK